MTIHSTISKAGLPAQELDNETVQSNSVSLTVTVEEACRLLNVSKPTMYKLAERPDFPSFKVGKKILINRMLLQDWLNAQSQKED